MLFSFIDRVGLVKCDINCKCLANQLLNYCSLSNPYASCCRLCWMSTSLATNIEYYLYTKVTYHRPTVDDRLIVNKCLASYLNHVLHLFFNFVTNVMPTLHVVYVMYALWSVTLYRSVTACCI